MKKHLFAGLATGLLIAGLAGSASAADFVTKHKGAWIIDFRVTDVDPAAGDPILTAGTGGGGGGGGMTLKLVGTDTGLKANVGSSTMPTLGFTYFLTDNIAVEAILGTTKHKVYADAAPVASTWVLPPVVAVQYHFAPDQKVSPYVGAGVNYMLFYNKTNIAPFSHFDIGNAVGTSLQAGVDVVIQGPWSLNLDAKKVLVGSTAHTHLAGPGDLHAHVSLDPWVLSAGIARRY